MLVLDGAMLFSLKAKLSATLFGSTPSRPAKPMVQVFALTRQPIWLVADSWRQNWPAGRVGALPLRLVTWLKCRRMNAVTTRFWRAAGMPPETGMFGLT